MEMFINAIGSEATLKFIKSQLLMDDCSQKQFNNNSQSTNGIASNGKQY